MIYHHPQSLNQNHRHKSRNHLGWCYNLCQWTLHPPALFPTCLTVDGLDHKINHWDGFLVDTNDSTCWGSLHGFDIVYKMATTTVVWTQVQSIKSPHLIYILRVIAFHRIYYCSRRIRRENELPTSNNLPWRHHWVHSSFPPDRVDHLDGRYD